MSDYQLNDDGTVLFEFDSFSRTLRRPTLGEYRRAIESLGSMRDEVIQRTEMQAGTDDADRQGNVAVQLDLVIEWFDKTFVTLSGEGFPRAQATDQDGALVFDEGGAPVQVIDEDRLPSWLLNAELIGELVLHWQTNPSRRGAR